MPCEFLLEYILEKWTCAAFEPLQRTQYLFDCAESIYITYLLTRFASFTYRVTYRFSDPPVNMINVLYTSGATLRLQDQLMTTMPVPTLEWRSKDCIRGSLGSDLQDYRAYYECSF